jgi:hypothetical protein
VRASSRDVASEENGVPVSSGVLAIAIYVFLSTGISGMLSSSRV